MSDQENKNPNDQNQEVEKVETVSVEPSSDEKDDEYEKVFYLQTSGECGGKDDRPSESHFCVQ